MFKPTAKNTIVRNLTIALSLACIVAAGCDERGLRGVASFRIAGLDGANWSVGKPIALGSVFRLESPGGAMELHSDDTSKLVKLANGRWEAIGAGKVDVLAVNKAGEPADHVTLTIREPDTVRLAPTLDTGDDIDSAESGLVVLKDSVARVKIELLAGSERLQHGNVVSANTDIASTKVTLKDDILTVTATSVAKGALTLSVKDLPKLTDSRPLRCVTTAALDQVDVALKAFGGTNSKGNRFAIAWLVARTADNAPIVGVKSGWQAIDPTVNVLGPKPDQTSEYAFIEAPPGQVVGLRAKIAGETFDLVTTIPHGETN